MPTQTSSIKYFHFFFSRWYKKRRMDVRYRTRREIRKCEAALWHRLVEARRDWNRRLRGGDEALGGGGGPRKTHNTGINYWGSKRRIAPEIVRRILPAFSKKDARSPNPFAAPRTFPQS